MTDGDDRSIVAFHDIAVFKPRDFFRLRGRECSLQSAAGTAAEEINVSRMSAVLFTIGDRGLDSTEGDAALPHPSKRMIRAACAHVPVSASVVGSHELTAA
jgi:hypothetical protein